MAEGEKGNFVAAFNRTEAELLRMEENEFRARFRERTHHTLEIQIYACGYRGKTLCAEQANTVRMYLQVWQARRLRDTLPEYIYANKLLQMAEQLTASGQINLQPYATVPLDQLEQKHFERVVYERRSVREWTTQRVPDELIERVLNAGLWAAHACNLQSIRYLIIREENEQGLFRGSDIQGGPVHLVIVQDMRVYRANPVMPESNQLLDAGAAAQNIVLAAHACGLGGCWLTFTSEQMKQRIRERFGLEEHYRLTTYVDVGYPDQSPFPPQRGTVSEHILVWR